MKNIETPNDISQNVWNIEKKDKIQEEINQTLLEILNWKEIY